jgi:excinuclease ABC subunit B
VLIGTGEGRGPGAFGVGGFEDAATIGHNFEAVISDLAARMRAAAADLDFEEAARLRDEIRRLEADDLGISPATAQQQKLERARFLLQEPGAPYRAAQQRNKSMRGAHRGGGRSRGGRRPIRG